MPIIENTFMSTLLWNFKIGCDGKSNTTFRFEDVIHGEHRSLPCAVLTETPTQKNLFILNSTAEYIGILKYI